MDTVRQHPDSPRAPELRDINAFLAAVRTALPPDHAAFLTGLRVWLRLDIDDTGTVTRGAAEPDTDADVGAAVLAAVCASGFHPVQRAGVAVAMVDHRMHLSLAAAALGPRR